MNALFPAFAIDARARRYRYVRIGEVGQVRLCVFAGIVEQHPVNVFASDIALAKVALGLVQ